MILRERVGRGRDLIDRDRFSGTVYSARGRSAPADSSLLIQGGSLRTWSFQSAAVEDVEVILSTEGRPIDADIELWHGPDNTPSKMRVYVEDGLLTPFRAVVETPRGPNTIAVRNIAQLEFPLQATLAANSGYLPSMDDDESLSQVIQGGALRTFPFHPSVDVVKVLLTTEGRPLNARIELLQGPNNNKQVVELYSEDGWDRPFCCFLETGGGLGNVVRIVNTASVEFPMYATVLPESVGGRGGYDDVGYGGYGGYDDDYAPPRRRGFGGRGGFGFRGGGGRFRGRW